MSRSGRNGTRRFWLVACVRDLVLCAGVAAMCLVPVARAELRVTVSGDADHHLELAQIPSSFEAELTGLTGDDTPVFGVAGCATLGSRLAGWARSAELNLDVLVARYNLVNMWSGNLCGGKTDVMPSGAEAKAWLDDLAGLSRAEDGAPFIDARRRLAEVLVFGAPGVAPDLARAKIYLAAEAARDPSMLLFSAYMAERGLGGAPDRAQALVQIRAAADRGNADAEALLAQAQELGLGVTRDEAGALARYERLAGLVAPPVWFRLGLMLLDGRGTKADACRAGQFLQRAAGHAWAPVPVAADYLKRLSDQASCPAPAP